MDFGISWVGEALASKRWECVAWTSESRGSVDTGIKTVGVRGMDFGISWVGGHAGSASHNLVRRTENAPPQTRAAASTCGLVVGQPLLLTASSTLSPPCAKSKRTLAKPDNRESATRAASRHTAFALTGGASPPSRTASNARAQSTFNRSLSR
eukprot:5548555-Prymnesium_polylepis.1